MSSANIESDPLFVLLTDALRAGPGSAQWTEAVAALRQQGAEGADEQRLLLEARQNLESGKEYRAVRAGVGFTRKLMGEIDSQSGRGPRTGIPTATLVAIVCGLLVLSAIVYMGIRMVSTGPNGPAAIDELEARSQSFLDTIASANFAKAIPTGWMSIGSLPLQAAGGLKPGSDAEKDSKGLGGGVRWDGSIPAKQPFAVDVSVGASQPTSALLLEVFVSTDANFSKDKGTSSRDLVWQLQGRDQHVLLNGSGQTLAAPPAFHHGDTVRVIVDQNVAIVEIIPAAAGGKPTRLWAGQHELGADPRYVGVRFLQTGVPGKQDLSVQQIKITH